MGKRNADSNGHESPNKRVKYDSTCTADDTPPADAGQDLVLTRDIVVGTVLTDLNQKRWRVGKPIGYYILMKTIYFF